MSILYKDGSGQVNPVAGLNGLAGDLVYGVNTTRSGTVSVTPSQVIGGAALGTVTFEDSMPDSDYNIDWSSNGRDVSVEIVTSTKTASGFQFRVSTLHSDAVGTPVVITYTAYKLYDVANEDELDSRLDTIEAVIPSEASEDNHLMTRQGILLSGDIDLNEYVSNGTYIGKNSSITSVTNAPSKASYITNGFGLQIQSYNSSENANSAFCTQVLSVYTEKTIFIRSRYWGGSAFVWSDWQTVTANPEIDLSLVVSGTRLNVSTLQSTYGNGIYQVFVRGSNSKGSYTMDIIDGAFLIYGVYSGQVGGECNNLSNGLNFQTFSTNINTISNIEKIKSH